MAHKKGLGSSRNGRDSNAKRLGVKVFAGQTVTGGEIIVRQRGTKFKPGIGVGIGKDDTIYARAAGTVEFKEGRRGRVISVLPAAVGVSSDARAPRARAGHAAERAPEASPSAAPARPVRSAMRASGASCARASASPPCSGTRPA